MAFKLERWGETILGAAVAAVAVGFFVFASTQAGASGPAQGSYTLTAHFQNVGAVNTGSDVRVSGVKVGVVRSVTLDSDYRALVTIAVNPGIEVMNDSVARIASDGLLGTAYISIEPTGDTPLKPGEEIIYTNGYVDLLTVMSQAMQGQGGNSTRQDNP